MLLIGHIRKARRKAREAACAEMLALLRDLGAEAASGGPLSDRPGVFWVDLPEESLPEAERRLPLLGYTAAVDLPEPAEGQQRDRTETVRFRRREWTLRRLYEEDESAMRAEAPDKRSFLLGGRDGRSRLVQGYRGGSAPGERRALPAYDARLLVNLVAVGARPARLLDPFAGAWSVVRHSLKFDLSVCSTDVDPLLAPGLQRIGAAHSAADARMLPFADRSLGAIATEPPYDPRGGEALLAALPELHRVLAPGARMAMLCARWQAEGVRQQGEALGLHTLTACDIDRKGSDCALILCEKPSTPVG